MFLGILGRIWCSRNDSMRRNTAVPNNTENESIGTNKASCIDPVNTVLY